MLYSFQTELMAAGICWLVVKECINPLTYFDACKMSESPDAN